MGLWYVRMSILLRVFYDKTAWIAVLRYVKKTVRTAERVLLVYSSILWNLLKLCIVHAADCSSNLFKRKAGGNHTDPLDNDISWAESQIGHEVVQYKLIR